MAHHRTRPRPQSALVLVALALAVTGCTAPGDVATAASPSASSSTASGPPTPSAALTTGPLPVAPSASPEPSVGTPTTDPTDTPAPGPDDPSPVDGHRVLFVTGGGCFDAEVPDCPRFDASVPEDAWQALRTGALPPTEGIDDGIGCGGEYVDGVSVRAVALDGDRDPEAPPAAACLSDADDDDAAAAALWQAYTDGAEVVRTASWTGAVVRVEVGGGCALTDPDGCPDPLVRTAADGPVLAAVSDADLERHPMPGLDVVDHVGSCGNAPSDGLGVLVTVRREAGARTVGQTVVACLDEFPDGTLSDLVAGMADEASS